MSSSYSILIAVVVMLTVTIHNNSSDAFTVMHPCYSKSIAKMQQQHHQQYQHHYSNSHSIRIADTSLHYNNGVDGSIQSTRALDYLGLINFCLRPSDSAMSGSSRSKVLNELTNEVFRCVMIGFDTLTNELLAKLDTYRQQVKDATCTLQDDDMKVPSSSSNSNTRSYKDRCEDDLQTALLYVDRLQALLENQMIEEGSILGGIYDRGYKSLLTALKDAGCKFDNKMLALSDVDICLSIMDNKFPLQRTKTKGLNVLSNCVSRAMLYGSMSEKKLLASAVVSMKDRFVNEWCGGNLLCQESIYMDALQLLLLEGITIAELTFIRSFSNDMSSESGASNISFRPVGFDSVAETIKISTRNGVEKVIQPTKLYDPYQNSFKRVIGSFVRELGTRDGQVLPQSDDLLLNFVNWEQNVRRNLTGSSWPVNPVELSGTWLLKDIVDDGALMLQDYYESNAKDGVEIDLLSDGSVDVKQLTASKGINWQFRPGPAHLDTLEFNLSSRDNAELTLKFVGFIDRGQRIESRLSRSAIRMSGRCMSIVNGDIQGSNKFLMTLRRK